MKDSRTHLQSVAHTTECDVLQRHAVCVHVACLPTEWLGCGEIRRPPSLLLCLKWCRMQAEAALEQQQLQPAAVAGGTAAAAAAAAHQQLKAAVLR